MKAPPNRQTTITPKEISPEDMEWAHQQELILGIVGLGFVGKSIDYIFSTKWVKKVIVDPKYSQTTIDDLWGERPHIVFICLPTPSNDDGSVNGDLVLDAVKTINAKSKAFIVIKSTLTPDLVASAMELCDRLAYEPEFLTEANAKQDACHPKYRVIGAKDPSAGQYLQQMYQYHSLADGCPAISLTPVEAAYFKYAVNSFLSMKVTFLNQLKQLMDNTYGSYNQLQKSLMADTRMGNSHFKIPGPDGREGYGGACFPKDVNAFISYAKSNGVDLSLLKETTAVNNEIRSQYELNEREKEQNVNYGQAKEELKDKNNGSSKQK